MSYAVADAETGAVDAAVGRPKGLRRLHPGRRDRVVMADYEIAGLR